MASYPNSIYTPREVEDKSGAVYDPDKETVVYAKDKNDSDNEIVAVETELGTNPKIRFHFERMIQFGRLCGWVEAVGLKFLDLGQQFSQFHIDSLAYLGNGIALAGTNPGGKILRST